MSSISRKTPLCDGITALWSRTPGRALCLLIVLIAGLVLVACGNNGTTSSGEVVTREIGVLGEELLFDTERITVTASQSVRLVFRNTSTTSEHNWVLVRGGEDVALRVDQAGSIAGASQGYLPGKKNDIIDHTRLLAAGENTEITFSAPAPGTYMYICTVPGHYEAGMKGELVVTP
jgi:uncharacterized cupredoxin-like copper-binding protein